MSDPFGCGYAVSHSEPSALIPLMSYILFHMWVMVMVMVIVMERWWFYMVIWH